jgi:DNA-binding CsgD family transcriptional regulator
MLHGGFHEVLQSRDPVELRNQIIRFAKALGFDIVSAMTVIDKGPGISQFFTVHNTPVGYTGIFEDSQTCKRDPVMQHCRNHTVPIVWDQGTYTASGQGERWEEQARFGYRTGIALALHLPEGRHFQLGVDRDQRLPLDRVELTRLVADLQLFAVHAVDAALRVLVPQANDTEQAVLTKREIESLSWTMEGKTAWEVGKILGISERTAVLHINNAMHKLQCVSKHQAVLKAMRLGLIH